MRLYRIPTTPWTPPKPAGQVDMPVCCSRCGGLTCVIVEALGKAKTETVVVDCSDCGHRYTGTITRGKKA